jgi:hypothetical protein
MNVHRGLLRLWIAVSGLWIAVSAWLFWKSCIAGPDGALWCTIGDDDWIAELSYFGFRDAVRLAIWLFGVPLACFVLGRAFLWVRNGFLSAPKSN